VGGVPAGAGTGVATGTGLTVGVGVGVGVAAAGLVGGATAGSVTLLDVAARGAAAAGGGGGTTGFGSCAVTSVEHSKVSEPNNPDQPKRRRIIATNICGQAMLVSC